MYSRIRIYRSIANSWGKINAESGKAANREAVYACINYGEAVCPKEIAGQSIAVNADIREVLSALLL